MKTFKQYLFLLEADETTLYNQLYKNIDRNVYHHIIVYDPTSTLGKDFFVTKVGKYSKWVLELYKKDKNFAKTIFDNNYLELLRDIYNAFQLYDKHKNKLTGEFEKYKNITNIKTVNELLDVAHFINKTISSEQIASRGDIQQAEKDVDTIYEDDRWQVVIPKTYQASVKWGHKCANASWCTASSSAMTHYNRYAAQDHLYIFYNKTLPEGSYQLFINDPKENKLEFNNVKNHDADIFKILFLPYPKLQELYLKKIKPESIKIREDVGYYQNIMIKRIKETNSIYILAAALTQFSGDLDYFKRLVANFKGNINQDILIKDEPNGKKEYTRLLDMSIDSRNYSLYDFNIFEYLWGIGVRDFYDKTLGIALISKRASNLKLYSDALNYYLEDVNNLTEEQQATILNNLISEHTADDSPNEELRKTIESGIDPNIDEGKVFSFACKKRNQNIIKYLIKNGADVTIGDNLALLTVTHLNYWGVMELLIENGAEVTDDVFSAACQQYVPDVLKYLLIHGGNIDAEDGEPLILSCGRRGDPRTAKFLLQHGANPNIRNGEPLMQIMYNNSSHSLEPLQDLIDAGADLNIRDGEAMKIVTNKAKMEMILKNGADLNIDNGSIITSMVRREDYVTLLFVLDIAIDTIKPETFQHVFDDIEDMKKWKTIHGDWITTIKDKIKEHEAKKKNENI